jgi:hypothetical protein
MRLLPSPAWITADLELPVKVINKTFPSDSYFKRTDHTNSEEVAEYLRQGTSLLTEQKELAELTLTFAKAVLIYYQH